MTTAPRPLRRLAPISLLVSCLTVLGIMAGEGCAPNPPPKPTSQPFAQLPLAQVPHWMEGTIFQHVVVGNVAPKHIGGYSLVVNLRGTGDGTAPTMVRDYLTKRILLHNLGTLGDTYRQMTPDQVLNDKRVAVVSVEADLPPGAREGQPIDITVRAMPRSKTSSLASGRLYDTELSERGLDNPTAIGANVLAKVAAGEVFVNPAYALTAVKPSDTEARASLRVGTMMHGGQVQHDRPIFLQLRVPQGATARQIEFLVRQRFPYLTKDVPWDVAKTVAAENDGMVQLFVPDQFHGDWRHYVGVVTHIFLDDRPEIMFYKARELVKEAHQPDAKLMDLSYAWEAMGEDALNTYEPLIADPDPAVAFAAARAAAFNGDFAARRALLTMAGDPSNPYQYSAVQTLGGLPMTAEIQHMMRTLLDSEHVSVRLEAYRILVGNSDAIFTKQLRNGFLLDIINTKGPPLVYATRTGLPRIAVFAPGSMTLQSPLIFMAADKRLTITNLKDSERLTIFYRDPEQRKSRQVISENDLAVILGRLGGEGPDEDSTFDFDYGEVVAIVQKLSEAHLLQGQTLSGQRQETAFVLEHPALGATSLASMGDDTTITGRPQGDGGTPPKPDQASSEGTGRKSGT